MLKNFEPRLYQQTILGTAVKHNTLVVLPTGLGKTALAFLLAIQRLHKFPDSKILMLAPTKPLCEQHVDTFRKHLEIEESQVVLFTGSVTPTKRQELWKTAKIIISTPQGLENDLINRRISFEEVSALVFDECHHATKDYSYVWLAEQYQQRSLHPKILALTASPGATLDKIQEICKNLFIKKVEVRTNADYDVKPYVKKTEVDWIGLEFPEDFKRTHKELKSCAERKLNLIKSFGYITTININKTQVLKLQRFLQSKLSQEGQNFEVLKSLSLVAEVLKVEHALELLECQGIKPLHTYLQKLWEESKTTKTKAVKNLAIDHNFRTAMILTESLNNRNIGYPKLTKLTELINEELNKDQKSKDYSHIKDTYRPSHADYVYDKKYGHRDYRGGGRSSARETACRVVAGAIAKQILSDIKITAFVSSVGKIKIKKHYSELDFSEIEKNPVRCADSQTALLMEDHIKETRKAILDGNQLASFIYPTSGKEGIQVIVDIINGKNIQKNIILDTILITKENANDISPIF